MKVENLEDLYELSPMQQGMLFQSLYAPQSGVYCLQFSCVLRGDLDVRAFVQAWQQILERHPILRTSFFWEEIDKPLQVVQRRAALPLEEQDWRALSTTEQAMRLQSFLEADRQRGFDLSAAPLMRLALIRVAEDSHRLIWSFHHLLLDGWSLSLLFKELFALYDASALGESLHLERSRPFRDYISWLQQQDLSQAEAFWRESLKGFNTRTPLSLERSSISAGEERSFDEHRFKLPESITNTLQRFARQHQLTTNTLVQGAWALLLNRYSGEREVVFGVTTAGRPADLQGAEHMIGLFINTLPARIAVPERETVLTWLKRLQQQQAEARHYEYTPLAQVQRWSEVTAGGSLFDSIVVFENYPVADILLELSSANKLQITELGLHGQTEYPLTVVAALGRELTLSIAYDSSRFNKSAIERMAGHLQVLLKGILTNPHQPIAHLPLLTDHERHQLLHQWNDTQQQYPSSYIHELFASQVERTPDAIALIFEEERLSYRELNERANQLAHYLRAMGVGPESLVGVLQERSTELVISLLAVLKAGGAYLPLDPEYPQERLSFMLRDSQPTVLLTQAQLIEPLSTHQVQTLCVDADLFVAESRKNPESTVSADNLAYVIYTSGSTGTPKGAMNTHRAVSNRLLWMQHRYSLAADDVVLQKTPFSFDVSVWELFWPLITGAQLLVARPGGHRDPQYLREVIEQAGVTTLHFVPSMLSAFLDEPKVEQQCGSVRRVICSGEALSIELQERFFRRFSEAELHNLYGPTEAAIDVTHWTCEREGERASVPIGRPIANTRMYILDEGMRLVPVGVSGELYIGGVAVGRGYLGRAELTAERYVPDMYSGQAGGRLYRTGDVCRWGRDGEIEYVGRNDEQVKVRGYRIELGEVEAALRRCRGVRECVVVAVREEWKEGRLIAYVVEEEGEVRVSAWREQLEREIPEYMMPAVYVKMEELPLTPSGKVDRRALPQVKMDRSMLGSAYTAPYTPAEELLVGIWSEVLNVEQVGVLDNFFELGGDSIRSIQIFAKAQQVGLGFSIQQLFEYPTIRQLARVAGFPEADQLETPAIKEFSLIPESDRQRLPDDVEDAYPLTPLQAGMIFHSEYRPAAAIYHDVFSFHIKALFDSEILRAVLRELLARHPVLRTSFDLTHFSEPLQLVRRTVPVPLEMDDLGLHSPERQEELLAAWIETEKSRQFDWAQAPLVRFYVHLRSDKSFQLTLSFHHAVLDGWSVTSMLAEIFRHYASQLKREPTPLELTPPVAKFRDFVALERATLNSEDCRPYWNEKLRGHTFIKIPRRHSSPQPSDLMKSRTHEVPISSELSSRLFAAAREASVPLKSVLLAAHLQVMRLLSGQSDVLTGLVSNGRPEMTDGERVLGLFLNALPFRLQLKGGTWIDLLQATFAAERELLPFRRYPMAQIQREHGGQALFEAGFNFNHFHLFKSLPQQAGIEMVDSSFFGATNYLLTANFGMAGFPSQIQLILAYNASELSDGQVIAYGNYYARALDSIANSPTARYEHTNLLTEGEQRQQLYEWNDTRRDYPSHSLHEQFQAQVERSPDALALVFEAQSLTYQELNQRANQLAHYLQAIGVRPDSLVGILMHRSPAMITSVLAVLKAGAAYVPLDPEYPQERLSLMLADARVSVLLTEEKLRSVVAEIEAAVVCVDSQWEVIQEQEAANPQSGVSPDNLAYVIYTSGSTGTPNGVLITHHNISNLIAAARSIFALHAGSRVLCVASFSFDASLLEMFLSLTSGASLYLSNAEERVSIEELERLIEREQLTAAVLTPTHLKALDEERCRSLRVVSSGAERLTAEVASRWTRGGRRLLNCYGPTEATVFATYQEYQDQRDEKEGSEEAEHSAESEASERSREPGIGRGIGNVEVYVLDEWLQVVPVGVSGELYVGGAGVGRGYLGRADLTASRYVPDPYSGESGARMYRTGDVCRWREAGELEYVGRRDEQVKVRGQRVELGEIEAAVREEAGVRECVVVEQESGAGDGEKHLVAYVVAHQASSPRAAQTTAEATTATAATAERKRSETNPPPPLQRHAFPSERIELCPSVAEYFVYDEYLYQTLTHDEKRNHKYRAVIERNVRDRVVLDIGTGPDAILARLCVAAGARRVYAVEVLEESYRQAVEKVRSLGLAERIILLHGDSREISLPERVDVCVSEIVGSIGGSEGAGLIVGDARRFLKPDGVMIPARSVTRVAAVSLPEEVRENPGFTELSAHYAEQIFAEVGRRFDLRLCIRNFPARDVISESGVFEELDFSRAQETDYRREIELAISRKGRWDGFVVWMELEVGAGEVIDILEGGYSWYPVYFPVFDRGVEVEEGDRIVGECGGRLSENGINPDYWVRGKLVRREGGEEEEFEYETKHEGGGYRERELYRVIFGAEGSIKKREEKELTSRGLRAELKKRLPEFMIPHTFLILDSLPLTPSGKIDRNSLPTPSTIKSEAARVYVAPRTSLEQSLALMWGHLLGVEQVGIHDNFFDLGGHSLLSTRLISHVRQEFAVEMPLRRLFEIPTIAMLAEEIEKLRQHDDPLKESAIKPLSRASRRMARAALEQQP